MSNTIQAEWDIIVAAATRIHGMTQDREGRLELRKLRAATDDSSLVARLAATACMAGPYRTDSAAFAIGLYMHCLYRLCEFSGMKVADAARAFLTYGKELQADEAAGAAVVPNAPGAKGIQ